ncbi:MAG: DUF5134 domain-containing protein [Acidimicrobiales bacterium]
MIHPVGLPYGLAVVMAAVSLYCIGRLAVARRWHRRNDVAVNLSHVLMGVAMVGQLVPRWTVLPIGLWEVVFGAMAVYFVAPAVRALGRRGPTGTDAEFLHHLSHSIIHMVMACAMLDMYWLGTPGTAVSHTAMSSMSGPPAGVGDPGLTLIIIAALLASAVWQLDRLPASSPRQLALAATAVGGGGGEPVGGEDDDPDSGDARTWLAPRLEMACHIAMCVTMGYMLVLML